MDKIKVQDRLTKLGWYAVQDKLINLGWCVKRNINAIIHSSKGMYHRIERWFQRANNGYDFSDRNDIGYWFIRIMPKMLHEYKDKHTTYPLELEGESKTYEDCQKEWNDIIDKMIFLLTEMDEDTSSVRWWEGEKSKSAMEEAFKYYEDCKNKFFELFSKYFYMLWD